MAEVLEPWPSTGGSPQLDSPGRIRAPFEDLKINFLGMRRVGSSAGV
jgi:hypothetical protein